MILWILLACSWTLAIGQEGVVLDSLPDGLMVFTDGDVKELRGTWSLFLSLRTPIQIFGSDFAHFSNNKRRIKAHLDAFTSYILETDENNSSYDLTLYHGRLAAIDYYFMDLPWTINSQSTRSRSHRSIDIVGDGLSWAFGVATKKQLKEVSVVVDQLVEQQQMDRHVISDLYSVVNQEHLLLNETRSALAVLHSQLNEVVARYGREFALVKKRVVTIQLGNMINTLETQAALIRSRLMEWHNLKNNLEHSFLDEYLLPSTLYSKISDLVLQLGFSTLPASWYHEHVPTVLEGFMSNTYFYRIDLPLVGHDVFTLARFHTWPVPGTNGVAKQLKLMPQMVFNTRLGYFFDPSSCVGRNPIVCTSSATYASTTLLCERAVLTGHHSAQDLCPVTVLPFNDSLIYPLQHGQYVVSVPALPFVVSCSNQPQRQVSVRAGTYHVHLDAACTLAAPNWSLRGLVQRTGNFTVQPFHRLHLVPLKLDTMVNLHGYVPVTFPSLNLTEINTLAPLHWSGAGGPNSSWYTQASDHVSWIMFPIIIILVLVGYLLFKRGVFRLLWGKIQNKPEVAEAAPVDMDSVVNDTTVSTEALTPGPQPTSSRSAGGPGSRLFTVKWKGKPFTLAL